MSRTLSELLAALSEPLEPKRAPFYVRNDGAGRPDGWYMELEHRTVYIGRDGLHAHRKLRAMLNGGSHRAAS